MERIDSALLVRDLCRDRPTDVLEAIKKRYLRVSTQDLDIFLVPPENLIFKRIVLPLKFAKQAFCFADFIACVALCGMVCEMAILFLCDLAASLWDMNRLRHKKIFAGGNYDDSPRNNGSERETRDVLRTQYPCDFRATMARTSSFFLEHRESP